MSPSSGVDVRAILLPGLSVLSCKMGAVLFYEASRVVVRFLLENKKYFKLEASYLKMKGCQIGGVVENQGHILSTTLALGRVKDESEGSRSMARQGHGVSPQNVHVMQQAEAIFSYSSSLFIVSQIHPLPKCTSLFP